MDLLNEEILKPKKKKEIKTSTIIIWAIVLLSILCIIAIVGIVYIKSTILTITLDGQDAKSLEEIFIIEEDNKIYMPVRKMAEYLNYDSYNGDYITRSEDETKCYIESEDELVSFTLNSNIITKVIENQAQQVKIAEPIKEINGELCITSEGAQDAFNLKFYKSENKIEIYTLTYLYNWYYADSINRGYSEIEETFENKRAVLDNMLIVKSENNYYGVIGTNRETVLECKYDSIKYLRESGEFLVESNKKKGIITKEKETKIELSYDNIQKVINKNETFYIVEKSKLYGLLDKEGNTIIYPEYEQIGIDVTQYSQNGVTNGNILYNQIVPVKRDSKWALFDTTGKKITDFIYDSFGCPSKLYRTYGVIEVLDYNLIVVCQGGKYNLITLEGKTLFDRYILDSVYITISEGKNVYYITSGTTTKELIGFLQENGVKKPEPIQ